MKNILLTIFLFGYFIPFSYSQTNCLNAIDLPEIKTRKITSTKKIIFTLDSLKTKIFTDTSKFDVRDLEITLPSGKTQNGKRYSLLYVVEGYSYTLDIIHNKAVEEFVNEMLVASKIRRLYIVTKEEAEKMGQTTAIVYIDLKKKAKVNFKVAGLNTEKAMNNFYQLEEKKVKFD